ncbi:MAG: HlyD family efflux transporter periplasmic adaptor subunit [Myxococcales bacterium]|nr:MAG: HlyD family efflux transporter periplasmic adaptor subunit [Myxococcales bacterium]
MQGFKRHIYLALWIAAAAVALFLYFDWQRNSQVLGIVETRVRKIGPLEPGIVGEALVSVGEATRKGQVLARLDIADLEADRERYQRELAANEAYLAADRQRFLIDQERERLRIKTDVLSLLEKEAELKAKQAELESVEAEIQKLSLAAEAGLGQGRDLSALIVKRDTLRGYVRSLAAALSAQNRSLGPARDTFDRWPDADPQKVVLSYLAERLEMSDELRRHIAEIDVRIQSRTVIAPCEGYVVALHAGPGDTVEAFLPLVSIQEKEAWFIDAYVPERKDVDIHIGDRAIIASDRSEAGEARGTVTFVQEGFAPIPQRLSLDGRIFWARPLRIRLDTGHALLPGEAVQVEIVPADHAPSGAKPAAALPEVKPAAAEAVTNAPRGPSARLSEFKPIQIPSSLDAPKGVEPSGLTWLSDLGRFLVVSDEAGPGKARRLWLGLMSENGALDAETAAVDGVGALNDAEAIAPGTDGRLIVVASQNLSRKGKRSKGRQAIVALRREGKHFVSERQALFFEALVASYGPEELAALGLTPDKDVRRMPLDIEGAMIVGDALYLGLKEPVSSGGALIWRLGDLDEFLATGKLKAGQVVLIHRLPLTLADGRAAGIADLAIAAKDRALLLATPTGDDIGVPVSALFAVDGFGSSAPRVMKLADIPGRKAEGIARMADGRWMIVVDAGGGAPSFAIAEIDWP